MQSPEVLNSLWAGIIYKQELDFLLQRAVFYIRTQDNKLYTYYELIFEEILSFKFKNEKASPWQQAELFELYHSQDENQNFKFEMIFWDERYFIEVICKSWKVNLLKEFDDSD